MAVAAAAIPETSKSVLATAVQQILEEILFATVQVGTLH
jgi:hypothetical protein